MDFSEDDDYEGDAVLLQQVYDMEVELEDTFGVKEDGKCKIKLAIKKYEQE